MKEKIITVDDKEYIRIPIKTPLFKAGDDVAAIVKKVLKDQLIDGDIVFMSEKAVACTQNRAIPMKDIKPRKLAIILSKYVVKTPYGIGLGIPETMEMALRECGVLRILFAAFISVIGKIVGKSGWFYKVAGQKAGSIDGPTPYTIPPYNKCVVLGPIKPNEVCKKVASAIKFPFLIVDVNDIGGKVLGSSDLKIDLELIPRILKDNPLGQDDQQTPIGIIREK